MLLSWSELAYGRPSLCTVATLGSDRLGSAAFSKFLLALPWRCQAAMQVGGIHLVLSKFVNCWVHFCEAKTESAVSDGHLVVEWQFGLGVSYSFYLAQAGRSEVD